MKQNEKSEKGYQALELGLEGETAACFFLEKKGFSIVDRNYREQSGAKKGEIDLVAFSKSLNLLSFVEVKTRTGDPWIRPAAAVNLRKRKTLIRTGMDYLRSRNFPKVSIRFDIVEVWKFEVRSGILKRRKSKFRIRHIEGAFQLPGGMMYG